MRKISLLSILSFVLSACATSPEPEIFDIELISFETSEVPVQHDIVWFEPGYLLKFRSSGFIVNPKNIIENVVLMRCSDEEIIFQSGWVSAGTPSDNGSILYTAQFYKQTLDHLDLPLSLIHI